MTTMLDGDRNSPAAQLEAYGSDLARWPSTDAARSARQALLQDRAFRRAWDDEKRLDTAMAATRAAMDEEIRRSETVERLTRRLAVATSARLPAGVTWGRIAAAVLVAAVLGGTADLAFLGEPAAEVSDVVSVDVLLFGPEAVEL